MPAPSRDARLTANFLLHQHKFRDARRKTRCYPAAERCCRRSRGGGKRAAPTASKKELFEGTQGHCAAATPVLLQSLPAFGQPPRHDSVSRIRVGSPRLARKLPQTSFPTCFRRMSAPHSIRLPFKDIFPPLFRQDRANVRRAQV